MLIELGYTAGAVLAILVYFVAFAYMARKDVVGAAALAEITTLAAGAVIFTPMLTLYLTAPAPGSGMHALFQPPIWYEAMEYAYFISWILLAAFTLFIVAMGVDVSMAESMLRRQIGSRK